MIDYRRYVSWGLWGETTGYPQEDANYYVSWGLWTYSAISRGLRLVGSIWRGVIERFGFWF